MRPAVSAPPAPGSGPCHDEARCDLADIRPHALRLAEGRDPGLLHGERIVSGGASIPASRPGSRGPPATTFT